MNIEHRTLNEKQKKQKSEVGSQRSEGRRLEDWKVGRLEDWKVGRLEGEKIRR